MQRWSNILNILLISLLLGSCITSPDAPKLPRQPKQYTYLDASDEWGRLAEDKTIEFAKPLREYGLYHVDDIAMIQVYIVELHEKCEKWKSSNE